VLLPPVSVKREETELHTCGPHRLTSLFSVREAPLSTVPKPHGKAAQLSCRCSRLGVKAQMLDEIKFSYLDSSTVCPYV